MISLASIPFIAIGLFVLALLFKKRVVGALGWLVFSVYCASELSYYLLEKAEYFDAAIAFIFLAFTLLFAALMLKPASPGDREEAALHFTVTKIALITAALYFPFVAVPALETLIIALTTRITVTVLAMLGVSVYMVYPSSIYTTASMFHAVYKPIEIILACTAIQSMVLFAGLTLGVRAPRNRKLKAFLASVPTIYVLNIVRNVFVTASYFGSWFGPPLLSFDISHGIIARFYVMISLIVVAYAVFVLLPEALDLIENFFRYLSRRLTASIRIRG
ncbi:MAG TPA: archaeosortase A [Methanomicrobia archaeon]|nr:archaeosortase A [Methanomicrobia archaeon]